MSRVYDALRRMESERRPPGAVEANPAQPVQFLQSVVPEPVELRGVQSAKVDATGASRLVVLADPQSLGAEKFRALATRLQNMRNQKELKTLQITSSVAHEGKTLVTANLVVTFARNSGAKVLLVEGDLHKPALQSLLGLTELHGISQWWAARDHDPARPYMLLPRDPTLPDFCAPFLKTSKTASKPKAVPASCTPILATASWRMGLSAKSSKN